MKRQYTTIREQLRAGRSPSYVVEWRPERGKLRRLTFNDPTRAKEQADHIERLFANGVQSVSTIPLRTMIGIALMLQEIPDVPVHEVIHFYLAEHGLNGAPKVKVEDAGREFIESRSDLETYSIRQQASVKHHLSRFIAQFGDRPVNAIQVEEINDYLRSAVGGEPRTRLNHAITIASWGRWMRTKKKWLPFAAPSAFEEVERPKCRTKNKEIYAPEEMIRLLVFTPRDMLPFMTLGGFGGMRAAERVRLEPEHWQPDNAQFALTNDITKTAKRRIVEAAPNLIEWIELAGTVTAYQFPHRQTSKIAQAAGVSWKHNALRSSFASYHLQKYKNEALTAMLDGHSVAELSTSYKGITGVNDATAAQWFEITPAVVRAFAAERGLPTPVWDQSLIDRNNLTTSNTCAG